MAGFPPADTIGARFTPGPLALGLQGGGSFGAFTWGVLDRLLEQDGIGWDMLSGTSAGAVNAVLLADGLAEGGPAAARRKLAWFWEQVSRRTPSGASLMAVAALGASLRWVSPFALDPPELTPLRGLLEEAVDFERLRAAGSRGPRLLIAATRVRDGRPMLFRTPEITQEMVLASACLPFLGQPVLIGGEACWDGGFSANPPLRDLVLESSAPDVLLVRLLPAEQEAVPHQSHDIARRVQEMTFNAPLQREEEEVAELRRACAGRRLFRSGRCRRLERLRLHRIAAPEVVEGLERESPLDTGWPLLQRLMQAGRGAAEGWLAGG
ncbi:MAG: patatin-like phospholipase family protein [Acetobacteraceae bacterium]